MPADMHRLGHRLKKGESDILVVVFSQVRVPVGKFGLERLFAGTRHHCLFLNDHANGWYLGLDDQVNSRIEASISTTRPARIIYYGSSMGGYGALRAGLRRGDGEIHAFGPELLLGRPGYQSTEYGVLPDMCSPDGLAENAASFAHPLDLYFGAFDPVDAANASLAERLLPKARNNILKSSHASHDHLYSLNVIRKIIRTFERSVQAELTARDLYSSDTPQALAEFGRLAEDLASGECPDPSRVRGLPGFATNPGMMRLAAEAEAARSNLPDALDQMQRAETFVEGDPVASTLPKRWRKELPLRRVDWLQASNRIEEARDLLALTCSRFPVDAGMIARAEQLGLTLA